MRAEQVNSSTFRKTAEDAYDLERLQRELDVLAALEGSPFAPGLTGNYVAAQPNGYIDIEFISGQDMAEWISFDSETWTSQALEFGAARERLAQFIAAEMDFIARGVIYRDLNPDHIIFSGEKAVFVDLEASSLRLPGGQWAPANERCTWETMTPEECRGEPLSVQSTTYSVAVITYLVLSGQLPFRRSDSDSNPTQAYRTRSQNPLIIAGNFTPEQRNVFAAALSEDLTKRPETPQAFFGRLTEAFKC